MDQAGNAFMDRIFAPVAVLLLGLGTGVVQLLVPDLRGLPTLIFLVVGPGASLLNLTGMRRDTMFVLGSVATSIGLASLISQLLLALNGASGVALPLDSGLWVLLAISLLASLAALTRPESDASASS